MNELLFERICSLENLFDAWIRFSSGKHSRTDVIQFECALEDNLFDLRDQLVSGRYRHDPYRPFTIFDPKQRRIHKATVKDRVVHQALVNVIEPLFERRFIFDSFSCRRWKGTHAAVDRLRVFLRRLSDNHTRTVYVLKCDIKKFFASVDHGILFTLMRRVVRDKQTLGLIREVVGSFSGSRNKGLPLGNLTSQLFANVYLHELDRFVKFYLREKYYLRYCDYFLILTESRRRLKNLVPQLDRFLSGRLTLALHPRKVFVRSWSQGIDFLGYVLLPDATILRPKTARRSLRLVTEQNAISYFGLCSHADAHEFEQLIRNKVGLSHS